MTILTAPSLLPFLFNDMHAQVSPLLLLLNDVHGRILLVLCLLFLFFQGIYPCVCSLQRSK